MANSGSSSTRSDDGVQRNSTDLLKQRIILITGLIDTRKAEQVIRSLFYLSEEDSRKPIYIFMDSSDGETDSSLSIFDTICFLGVDVKAVNMGCMSTAALIIQLAAPLRNRFIFPNAYYLLNHPEKKIKGTASEIEVYARWIEKMKDKVYDLIKKETGLDINELTEGTERDFWLDAKEAVGFGIVSKIIGKKSDIFPDETSQTRPMEARTPVIVRKSTIQTFDGFSAKNFPDFFFHDNGRVNIIGSKTKKVRVHTDCMSNSEYRHTSIPYLGEIASLLDYVFSQKTANIIPSDIIDIMDNNRTCSIMDVEQIPVEVFVNGYLTGFLWGCYRSGVKPERLHLPEGLERNQKLDTDTVILGATSNTKGSIVLTSGDILIGNGTLSQEKLDGMISASLNVHGMIHAYLEEKGVILAESKYRFASLDGRLLLVGDFDFFHSCTAWFIDDYQKSMTDGVLPARIGTKRIREWSDGNPSGEEEIPDVVRISTMKDIFNIYRSISGREYIPSKNSVDSLEKQIRKALGA